MNLTVIFDVLLVGALLFVTWRLLQASDLFQATVLFISFGLFLALAWIRLQAPDIAVAEAAVGAGLAGVLLFGTFKTLEPDQFQEQDPNNQSDGSNAMNACRLDRFAACPGRTHYLLAGTVVALLTFLLILSVLELSQGNGGLAEQAASAMEQSGVEHPLTAVLLNFRLYDTWLELGVLLLALLAVLAVRDRQDMGTVPPEESPNPVLHRLVALLGPVVLLVSFQLLWLGKHAPGGAFQAGVVLAAGLVLLRLSGHPSITMLSRGALLSCIGVGFGSVLLMAMLTTLAPGSNPLEYPREWAGMLLVILEAAATLSIGVTLCSLVLTVLGEMRAT